MVRKDFLTTGNGSIFWELSQLASLAFSSFISSPVNTSKSIKLIKIWKVEKMQKIDTLNLLTRLPKTEILTKQKITWSKKQLSDVPQENKKTKDAKGQSSLDSRNLGSALATFIIDTCIKSFFRFA